MIVAELCMIVRIATDDFGADESGVDWTVR